MDTRQEIEALDRAIDAARKAIPATGDVTWFEARLGRLMLQRIALRESLGH